jgi:Predicted transcriptional regulator
MLELNRTTVVVRQEVLFMDIKLFDSELKVMNVLWREGDTTAKHISDVLNEEVGWNMNTTYTLIKRCIKKGAIERSEPKFMCHALIPKEEVQEAETNELINKIYDGSADKLFTALLGRKKLSAKQIENLKKIVGELK